MSNLKHVRTIVAEARAIAVPLGLTVDVTPHKGHHHLIFAAADGRERRWTLPGSPRDADHLVHNVRKHIKRIVQELSEE